MNTGAGRRREDRRFYSPQIAASGYATLPAPLPFNRAGVRPPVGLARFSFLRVRRCAKRGHRREGGSEPFLSRRQSRIRMAHGLFPRSRFNSGHAQVLFAPPAGLPVGRRARGVQLCIPFYHDGQHPAKITAAWDLTLDYSQPASKPPRQAHAAPIRGGG